MSSKKEYSLSEEAYRNKLEYIASYNKKFVRVQIQVTPEERDKIKALASDKGMSVKDLILSALWVYES
jgi:anti-sigma regulatory factor (Ser/Thr protein kinase)